MKLFIDDVRNPPDDSWVVARSSKEALSFVKENGLPDMISFDHDLGGEDTTRVFLHEITEMILDKKLTFKPFEYLIHSANPVGRDWIENYLENLHKFFRQTS